MSDVMSVTSPSSTEALKLIAEQLVSIVSPLPTSTLIVDVVATPDALNEPVPILIL